MNTTSETIYYIKNHDWRHIQHFIKNYTESSTALTRLQNHA